jgi:glycosyltransferase involved in cell wall biosynthesis
VDREKQAADCAMANEGRHVAESGGMRKLRIAVVSGGTFPHTRPYIDFYRQRGHEVFWIAFDRQIPDYGVPTFDISHGASARRPWSKWKYLWAGLSLRKILRRLRPDIVHGQYVSSAGPVCLLSGFRPYVLTAHGGDLLGHTKSLPRRMLLRPSLRRAALVNPVSRQLAEVVEELGVTRERILTATLGVDMDALPYRPRVEWHSPVRLLCTRGLRAVYDPVTILRACAILKRGNTQFTCTFAAGGPMEPELRTLARKEGLEGTVRFLGGYQHSGIAELLYDHDIYVSASLFDGSSLSLLEAMACGIFPVVSRIPSNQGWLDEGRTALMFAPGDAMELAERIRQSLESAALVREAVQANRSRVEERGSRHRNMGLLESQLYRLLAAEG